MDQLRIITLKDELLKIYVNLQTAFAAEIQCGSKLLPGFAWPVILKLEKTK
jgi:hypothetical protein